MISYIRGEVIDRNESSVVVDVNGLGYEVFVPYRVICSVERLEGPIELYTFLQVKEDGIALFGFPSKLELSVFKKLITVSGVGPKAGLSILSNMTCQNLILAVVSDDAKTISKVPGIGAKTAGKIILELKDKFSLSDTLEGGTFEKTSASAQPLPNPSGAAHDEAVAALVALGYSASESLKAIRSVPESDTMTTEQLLKNSLKYL